MNNDVMIRDADNADLQALTLLMNELGYPTKFAEMKARFPAIVVHPDYKTLVAVLNNEVVGMAGLVKGIYYEKNGSYMRINAFVVKQSHRKKGIGKVLINAAEAWAVSQGCQTMLLTSAMRDERKDAYAFYQNCGYQIKSSGFVKQL